MNVNLDRLESLIKEKNFIEVKSLLSELMSEDNLKLDFYVKLNQLIAESTGSGGVCAPEIRVAVLGTTTSHYISMAVRAALMLEGRIATIYESPFGALSQEVFSDDSELYEFSPDIILIYPLRVVDVLLPKVGVTEDHINQMIVHQTMHWKAIWDRLFQKLNKPIVHHLFEMQSEEFLGLAEKSIKSSPNQFTASLNQGLINAAPEFVHLMDLDVLAQRVGRRNWTEPRLYHHAKLPFNPKYLYDYIVFLRSGIRRLLSGAKKAIIVDLDNTLWGGVIGDDGIGGIVFGAGSSEGEAYLSFCKYLKALSERGIILAVCSKNDPKIAAEVFNMHDEMPLTLKDFAVFNCSWGDKVAGIKAIAHTLNIDLSAIVFVDDNPVECDFVERQLSQVAVVSMSGDPANFVEKLDGNHFFDRKNYSSEDFHRAESYAAKAKAMELFEASTGIEDYLDSLDMTAEILIDPVGEVVRLSQMEAKTNQFNLTTNRRTKDEIEKFCVEQCSTVIAVKLVDRFANHGIISYMTVERRANSFVILDWLMSCRVFSRTVEHFMINKLIEIASTEGVTKIIGQYLPTQKNSVVRNLFLDIGFKYEPNEDGSYLLNILDIEVAGIKTYIKNKPSNS